MKISREGVAAPHDQSAAYSIQAVERACRILKCMPHSRAGLTLTEIAQKTGLSRTTTFRLLATLVEQGMIEHPRRTEYRLNQMQSKGERRRIGYASQSEEFSFSRLVSESIRSAAYEAGVELIERSNRYSPTAAVRNAEEFARDRVDLVIEFQTSQQCASVVAARLVDAGIPLIAIEIPHPGADYYGANNHRAGVLAGRALGEAAAEQWDSRVDEVLLLELPMAGPVPRSRLTGVLAGIREILPRLPDQRIRFINGNGRFESSLIAVRRHLQRSNARHVLVGALNDPSCLGALEAFEECGRAAQCLAAGQNASIEARREMIRPGSRLIGSVGYFPERYGEAVLSLAIDKLQGKTIPSATFVRHRLITAENVASFYPNDKLISSGCDDSLLYSLH
jgi:ribose transport system substrate-binding protein